jgi:Carboxypeptidase regulatory-like domain
LAAKNLSGLGGGTGINAKSMEGGAQDWNQTCGACHPGGGQMEYDRNQNPYSATSPAGDYYRYQLPDKNHATGAIVPGWLSATNKAEIDCLLCHLHDSSNISGNGLAFLQSEGCSGANQIGPDNDPACTTIPDDAAPYSINGLTGAKWNPSWTGAKYDHYNRNIAIKAKKFDYAASLGMGAIATGFALDADGNPSFTGITGMPATLSGANIQGTPNSQNCSVCHARDDATAGLVGMHHMRVGYGGYELINPAGTAYDSEAATKTNAVRLLELGCKTGMGKRGHRIGHGPNDKYNDSKIVNIFGLGKAAGTTIATETLTIPAGKPLAGETIQTYERIPDQDIHDMGGMQCATCHYTLGSTSLEGGSKTIPATTFTDVLPLSAGTIVFPSKTYNGIDHQFAKFGTMEDTNSMPNINGTVTCESCHITRDHPRVVKGEINPPVPTHAGLPAIHLQKISCTTCHIPEVYAAPGRLKYRDFSLGYYKKGSDASGGWRNMLDWNWDFISWGAKPLPPVHVWATRNGKTQIVPVLPSTIPAWEETNTPTTTGANSDAAVAGKYGSCDINSTPTTSIGQACAVNADCGAGTCVGASLDTSGNQFFVANPGKGMTPGPVKARDTSLAALAVENNSTVLRRGTAGKGELNGANLVPLFDGFPLADSWGVDTKPRIDAMYAAGAGSELRIYQAARFDVTHGVVPKDWALGGSKRGGCISCHSSADQWQRDAVTGQYIKDAAGNPQPNPNYSPNSVAFFEGYQQPFMGQAPMFNDFFGVTYYDLVKNWFALFADVDGTAMTNGLHTTQGFCYNMCVNRMNMPYASCAQFCPSAGAAGSPTSNTAYAALYFCDDGAGGMPDQSTCGVNGHLGGFTMPSLDTGYMMGKTDSQYYDPTSGMPRSSSVIGLQYQCGSFSMTGGDCSAPGVAAECAMSGAPGDTCTSTVNPNWNKPISPNGRIYANFIMPCWDAQTNPTCAGTTMPNANYQTEAYDPFLAAVSGFMVTGFDTLMYYAPGTAQGLGWYDGFAALRLLTIKETVSGKTLGCDPYGAFDLGHRDGLLNCVPGNPTNNGTCNATYGMCMGGVASYMACATNADCQGKLTDGTELAHNPNGLLWTRADMRDHFQINLQQSCGGACTGNEANPLVPGGITYSNARLTWPIGSEANPENPAHVPAWDQAGKLNLCGAFQNQPCCSDQMGNPVTCADGTNVKTTIHANQLLGFPAATYAEIRKPALAGASYGSQSSLNCTACHAPLLNHPTSAGTPGLPTNASTCTTCHLAGTPAMQVHVGASIDVQTACGQCHGGSAGSGATKNGAPYYSLTALSSAAAVIHQSGLVSQVTATPVVSKGMVTVTGWAVSFTDASTDPDGTTDAVTVNWGDGNIDLGVMGGTFTHTYSNLRARNYIITHVVTDPVNPRLISKEAFSVNVPTRYTISGLVTTSTGTPMGSAYVFLKQNGHTKQYKKTAVNGSYSFSGVLPGDYTIHVFKFGTTYGADAAIIGLSSNLTMSTIKSITP